MLGTELSAEEMVVKTPDTAFNPYMAHDLPEETDIKQSLQNWLFHYSWGEWQMQRPL